MEAAQMKWRAAAAGPGEKKSVFQRERRLSDVYRDTSGGQLETQRLLRS